MLKSLTEYFNHGRVGPIFLTSLFNCNASIEGIEPLSTTQYPIIQPRRLVFYASYSQRVKVEYTHPRKYESDIVSWRTHDAV